MLTLHTRIRMMISLALFLYVPVLWAHETGKPLNLFDMTLEQLMELEVKVEVASLFPEEDLVAGSSVYRVDSKRWEYQGAKRVPEALENEISVFSYPTSGGALLTAVRGYGKKTGKGIAYLVDGIPINETSRGAATYHVPNWELGTLQGIEMIKGPGSALYGSDAFHGVISLKTVESQEDILKFCGAGATSGYGDAHLKLSRGVLGSMGRVDMAIAGSGQGDQEIRYEFPDGNGYYKDTYDSATGMIKLRLTPGDRLKVKFGAYMSDWDGGDFSGIAHMGSYDLSGSDTRFKMGRMLATYALGQDIFLESDLYAFQGDYEASNIISVTPFRESLLQEENTRSGATVMLKQQDNDFHFQWVAGFSYVESETRDTRFQIVDRIDLGELPFDGFRRDIRSIIAQAKWGVLDEQVYLLLGGRYDDYSDFKEQFSPRGGIIYLPTERSAVKVLYGRAFNAPAGGDLNGQPLIIYGNTALKPETIDVYELIYMCKGKEWKFNVSSFFSEWKNAIIIEPADNLPPGFSQRYVNRGRNRSYGIETSVNYPVSPLVVEFGGSYVKSEYQDAASPLSPGSTEDYEYDAFPAYSILLGLYYKLRPLDLDMHLNNRLYLEMKESPWEENPDADELDPFWRMDLNVNRSFTQRLSVTLNIRNLLDRKNHLPSLWGAEDGYLQPGISAMLRVTLTF